MNHFDDREEEPELEESKLSVEKIKEAMSILPEGSRMIFNMYLLEGLDHGEIASFLGINEATSRSQYLRARKKIKDVIAFNELEFQA